MSEPSSDRQQLSSSAVTAVLELWGEQGKQNVFTISGTSMWPFLRKGDGIYLQHGQQDARWGESILFRQQGRLIVHRVVWIQQQGNDIRYIALGDNSTRADAPVSKADILGRVQAIQRGDTLIDLTSGRWQRVGRILALMGWFWIRWEQLYNHLQHRLPSWGQRPLGLIRRIIKRLFVSSRRYLLHRVCCVRRDVYEQAR